MRKKLFRLFSLNQRKAVRDAKSAVATILSLKTYQKWFLCYLLPSSFKIFIHVFAFLYVKAISKEICEEMFFPSFFQKNADVSICANYLKEMRGYPHVSLLIPIALAKTHSFRMVLIWRKNLCI